MSILDNVCVKLCFDRDGRPTWFGIVCFFCVLILTVAVCSLLGGCMNCYTRCPGTRAEVTEVYQSTRAAACASVVVAFPQIMSDCPSAYRFDPINIVSIPLGALCLADAAVEGVLDTVCLPADYFIAEARKQENERK